MSTTREDFAPYEFTYKWCVGQKAVNYALPGKDDNKEFTERRSILFRRSGGTTGYTPFF